MKDRISSGNDIIGRDDTYKEIKVDKSFPQYILNNLHIYKEWIVN